MEVMPDGEKDTEGQGQEKAQEETQEGQVVGLAKTLGDSEWAKAL